MLICTKGGTTFIILTHLGHGRRRGPRGAREVHEKCTRGAREVHSWARNGNGYYPFWHTWDKVRTRLGHGWNTAGTRAPKVHKRCTREARGSQEVYERGYTYRGAR